MDNFRFLEKKRVHEEDKELVSKFDSPEQGTNHFSRVPDEILSHIFTYLDVKAFLRSPMVCREWQNVFQKKSTGKIFKRHCLNLWKTYQGTQSYLSNFMNWRQMLKLRPYIRFDGFYVCKIMYIRSGLSENSMNNPVH